MRPAFIHFILFTALVSLVCISLLAGRVPLSLADAVRSLLTGEDSISSLILWEVRLPRTILALTIGAALGLSGAALQGLLRNPLASPDLLGVSQTASLAAVVTLYFGLSAAFMLLLPVAAMAGAVVAVILIYLLAGRYPQVHTLILTGIALNAIMSALIALSLNLAPNPYALQEIYFWLLGSVANRSWTDVGFALPFIVMGSFLVLMSSTYLDALSLGEDTARSLGFNAKRCNTRLILGVAMCTGASVAVAGNIGFVGLLVPHLVRPLAKHSPARVLLLSMPAGAALVLLADILVNRMPSTQELQLGVVTSALGGPFFLFLILNRRKAETI